MDRFLLFVALSAAIAFGQAPPATGVLTGKVLDATTKEGIRKAMVYATVEQSTGGQAGVVQFKPPPIYSAMTDDSGVYRFAGMPFRSYFFRADRAGYLARQGAAATRITLTPGLEATVPDLLLVKQAILSGRVTDSEGEPVEAASVQAIPLRGFVNGNTQGRQGLTDDRGEFRIAHLAAGSYKLVATKPGGSLANVVSGPGEQLPQVNVPTYFPSTLDSGLATAIPVRPGEERTGLELRLLQSSAVQVAGRVTGELWPNAQVFLSLQPVNSARDGGMVLKSWNAMSGLDGRFAFTNVTPGEYVIHANAHHQSGQRSFSGGARVVVGAQPVTELAVPLVPRVSVSGRARADGEAKLPAGKVQVMLVPAESGLEGGVSGWAKPDGTFVLDGAPRTRLRVVPYAPSGWFLKSVSLGGQPSVVGFELDLSAGEAPVELLYGNKPGVVEVTVPNSEAGAGPIVAAALEDAGDGLPPLTNLYKTAPVPEGATGAKIESVAPGKYQIVVCSPMVLRSLSDPAVWEKVKEKAVAVKVVEGGTVSASPRQISENDLD